MWLTQVGSLVSDVYLPDVVSEYRVRSHWVWPKNKKYIPNNKILYYCVSKVDGVKNDSNWFQRKGHTWKDSENQL